LRRFALLLLLDFLCIVLSLIWDLEIIFSGFYITEI